MQLAKIILWPEKEGLQKRILEFKLGMVNYIIGEADTGKSSIWPIIDYCLCSSELRVPIGPARDLARWFGIVLSNNYTEVLIARQNNTIIDQKTGQKRKSIYMVVEGRSVKIPAMPQKNSSEEEVSKLLSQSLNIFLQKISNELLEEILDGFQDKKIGRLSFRDLLTLNHQMQYALVNPSSFISESHFISILKLKKFLPVLIYSEETALYRLKKGIQKKVEDERKNLKEHLLYLQKRIEFLYKMAISAGIALNPINPDIVIPSDNFLRGELENILKYNDHKSLGKDAILLLGQIKECLAFARIIDMDIEFDYELQVVKNDIGLIDHNTKAKNERSRLSSLIKAYARKLELSNLEYTPVFDEKDAVLKFLNDLTQSVYLYQLGNTQSYVGYNIATFLSFHEMFLEKKHKVVLPFLIIDHPFQAFNTNQEEINRDHSNLLALCFDFAVERLAREFQLVILEKMCPDISLSNSNVVERWNDSEEKFLIPKSWQLHL